MIAEPDREIRVLQRVVMPGEDNLDVVPLYVETDMERGARYDSERSDETAATAVANAVVGEARSSVRFGGGRGAGSVADIAARRTATVQAGERVSFATYFNAFPASYWRRWTVVERVTLRIRLAGQATVVVYRSTARGQSHPIESLGFDGDEPRSVELTLPLSQFIDGGWYWFDIAAGDGGATLLEADWAAEVERRPHGRISVGVTTFNRPDFVARLLGSIGDEGEVLTVLDAVYLVDQGTERAQDHPDFAAATKALGDRLQVVSQGNIGGSGGFSRAMDETLRAGASDYVVLLDDDVVLEPEGVLRATTFADLARRPTIVGGHMFSLYDRAVLNAFGETVAPYTWWWGAAPQTRSNHDFGLRGLRHTRWLHRRVDADYNGWWMCLVPTSIIAELGLSLPMFIKWDDAEYGLRARRAGYPTVSLPGAAVWHVPWHDKNDAVDWQAYYHIRNRLLTALLHSPYERGGRVVAESLEIQIQHLLSMQYSSAALRLLALEDLLSGPAHLHRDLLVKMGELRALQGQFGDALTAPDVEAFPPVRRRKPPGRGREISSPTNKVGLVVKAGLGALRQLAPVAERATRRPDMALPHQDASWWLLSNIDSAVVSAADGATAAWYRRDPKVFGPLLTRSLRAHGRLLREWPRLRRDYRAAAPDLTSQRQWRDTFAASIEREGRGA